jgi:hypothetical protein
MGGGGVVEAVALLKMTVFWNAPPCSLENLFDVSEVLTASIITHSST